MVRKSHIIEERHWSFDTSAVVSRPGRASEDPFGLRNSGSFDKNPAFHNLLASRLLEPHPANPIRGNPHNKPDESLNLEEIVSPTRQLIPKINMQLPTMHVD
jgi:hypothetical protein